MQRLFAVLAAGVGLITLAFAACAPAAPPVQPTTAPAQPTATSVPPTVKITQDSKLGPILTDRDGRTVYLFMRDERGKSSCSGTCADRWPAVTATGKPVGGQGVVGDLLSTIAREGGAMQVTYNGWPLYYNSGDTKPGDSNGQNAASGIWFVVSSYGGPIHDSALVKAAGAPGLDQILMDSSGRTLYIFMPDQKNKSACSGECAQFWPPMLSVNSPKAGDGAAENLLGTVKRDDGAQQVTYNGWPLYYFAADAKPGELKGQNSGGNWFVITPAGEANKAAAGAAPAAPGGASSGY